MAEKVISLQDLQIAFGDRKVLKGVNLDVEKGETVAVIGPSGSGKSTILRVIIGLLPASGGKVFLGGKDVTDYSEDEWNAIRIHMGMVFQYSALFDFLDVGENVAFGIRQHMDLDEASIQKIVDELLDVVEMSDSKHLYPSEMSGGMQKRISLARALAFRPEIVLYDEPTAGLDPIRTMNISRLIRKTQERYGVTSLLVSHDMDSVYYAADKIAMLNEGKIEMMGTVEEFRKSDNPVVKCFTKGIELKDYMKDGNKPE